MQNDSPYSLLPMKLDILMVRRLVWADFIELDYHESSVFYAHINWNINYTTASSDKFEILKTLTVRPSPKSWVLKSLKSPELLAHESGHYIIGCLCALQFLREVNIVKGFKNAEQINKKFNELLQKWVRIEKKYDDETEHYLNQEKQKQWDLRLERDLYQYMDVFDCKLPEE